MSKPSKLDALRQLREHGVVRPASDLVQREEAGVPVPEVWPVRVAPAEPDEAVGKAPNGSTIDVRAVRVRLGLSQPGFANAFGIDLATLRGWEQGRRQPRGAAKTLLILAERIPDHVRAALKSP